MTAETLLSQGLSALGLAQDPAPWLTWAQLLLHWNRAYNLTAIDQLEEVVSHHILDSLAILPMIQGRRIIDVGSGAGLPGLMLAIARPDWDITLLDGNGKKTRFLQEARRVLQLANVSVVHARAQAWQADVRFDTVTCRALCTIEELLDWTRHLVADDGQWLAMKGRPTDEELAAIPAAFEITRYRVPGLDAERSVIRIHNGNQESP